MKTAASYFVLSALQWIVVCWVGWSWVLGFHLPAWKMVAMACLSAFIQTVFVPLHAMVANRSSERG